MSRWHFSQNGVPLFVFWIFLPVLALTMQGFFRANIFTEKLVFFVIFLFLVMLLYYLSIEKIISKSIWKDLVAWYQSTFAMAIIYLFYGSFTYLTGMSPSKYHSVPVDKKEGLYYLFYAAIFAIIGGAAYWKHQLKR